MGILDKLKSGVSAVTPNPVEKLLFGHDEAPPTPTDPETARSMIDNIIGRQPQDYETIRKIKDAGMIAQVIESLPSYGLGTAYDGDTMAKLGTNQLNRPVEPYVMADQLIGDWLQQDPRRQSLYIREEDPLNPFYLPYVVEANAKHHDGIFAKGKNMVGDIVGRPIGGMLELLAKPAKEVELWYGNNFVWNDIPDASLRHAMAKYTYESRLNIKDWDMTWEAEARVKAQEIEGMGLKGDAAANAFKEWVQSEDGQMKVSGYVADMFGQILFDPLWLVPGSWFSKPVKGASAALTGTEDVGRLARLGTAAGRSYAGENTIKDLMKLSEINYTQMKLSSPGSRGSLLFLTERSPDRLADAAYSRAADVISGPLLQAGDDAYGQLEVLHRFEEVLRTGKLDEKSSAMFGANLLDEPVFAESHIHLRDMGKGLLEVTGKTKPKTKNILEGLLEGVTKNPEYLQVPTEERAFLLSQHVLGNLRSVVREGQNRFYPKWFTQRYLPVVAAQKALMGVFTLSRPGFVFLNMANNFFTYMWHAAGHPMQGTEIFARSMGAEFSTITKSGGQLPDYFKNLAKGANVDPVAVERTVVGNVSHLDVLGQKQGYPFRLDDEAVDVADAIKKAEKVIAQPLKDMNPRRFRDMVALPVTAAGRIDRMTRRSAYYYNLKQQLYMANGPERLLTQGVQGGMKGGVLPDLKDDLLKEGVPADLAEQTEGYIQMRMLAAFKDGKISLGDSKGIRKAYLEATAAMLKDTPATRLSSFDLGMRFMQRQGYDQSQSFLALSELDDVMLDVQKALDQADDIPMEQLRAKLMQIGDNFWTSDRIMAEMTKTDPIMRFQTDYARGMQFTEEGIRADLKDNLLHLERFLDTKVPNWHLNGAARRSVFGQMREYSVGRLNRLGNIRKQKIDALANGVPLEEAGLWKEYFEYTDEITRKMYDEAKAVVSRIDQTNLKPLDDWFADTERVSSRHREIISEAQRINTAEGWEKAGKDVSRLYRNSANRRAGRIFGWQPNEPAVNLGYDRPSAALTRQVDEYLGFIQDNLGQEMAKERVPGWSAAMRKIANQKAGEAAARGPEVARQIAANARFATDFVMLNYNNQYGIDSALQMVFPYEFFPTRTAANWVRRSMKAPGAAAMLSKALLNPQQYAEDYGLPDRLGYRLPILIPGLDNFLENIPYVGGKVKNGDFSNVYWIDPLAVLFPMANFRDEYIDEQKRSTPMGIVADWTEQNTPLSLSPFAKIVGSITGGLDRDSWTNSLFNGGPFGVPLSTYAHATNAWLQTGVPDGVPEEERDNYTDGGYFSKGWLGRLIGLAPDKFDTYRTERALSSMVAEGDIEAEVAWEALRNREGEVWDKAVATGNSEQFLAQFTGWLGFRAVGVQRGELIRLGERALYEKAAASGKLEEFYNKFPEYELQQVASKGLSDPEGRKQLMDNHFYYRDYEELVNAPYAEAENQIQQKLDAIRNKAVITETDKEQERYLLDELFSIKDEQDKIRDTLNLAYPDRDKEASLNTPPRERALQEIANGYYAIERNADETPEDFAARQQRWLDQFPAKMEGDNEQDWQAIFVAYQATAASYNLKVNNAYDAGEFDKGRRLREEKENALTQIHDIATKRITRYDVELYLNSQTRQLTQAEIEWEQANSMFDLWMSYVGESSPLSDRQKAAISAYFRADPLLQKHYNVGTIDLRSLNGDQLLALSRRREIKSHYFSLSTNAAKIDYIQAVQAEYNEINAMLGLPPLEVLDYRPAPPDVSYRDPYDALEDFQNQNLIDQILKEDASLTEADVRALIREEGGLTTEDIVRYVDPVVQRGY